MLDAVVCCNITGSKCPTGEYLYSIQTDDNARLKSLFNDLSQHKPIFTDDRVGRRMTLERSFNHKVGSHTKVANRFSLQQSSEQEQRLYQNHEAFASNNRHHSTDIPVEAMGRRHSAVEGDIFNPHAKQMPLDQSQRNSIGGSPKSAHSNEDLSNRQYQNVPRLSSHGRTSPTKKVQHTVMKAPLPQRYYSVEPPQALKKYRVSTNSTPPSSPDDEGFVQSAEGRNASPVDEEEDYELNEGYVDLINSELSVRVVGENLVFHKTQPSLQNRSSAGVSDAGLYQNLAFMQGNSRVPPTPPTEESDDSLRK